MNARRQPDISITVVGDHPAEAGAMDIAVHGPLLAVEVWRTKRSSGDTLKLQMQHGRARGSVSYLMSTQTEVDSVVRLLQEAIDKLTGVADHWEISEVDTPAELVGRTLQECLADGTLHIEGK